MSYASSGCVYNKCSAGPRPSLYSEAVVAVFQPMFAMCASSPWCCPQCVAVDVQLSRSFERSLFGFSEPRKLGGRLPEVCLRSCPRGPGIDFEHRRRPPPARPAHHPRGWLLRSSWAAWYRCAAERRGGGRGAGRGPHGRRAANEAAPRRSSLGLDRGKPSEPLGPSCGRQLPPQQRSPALPCAMGRCLLAPRSRNLATRPVSDGGAPAPRSHLGPVPLATHALDGLTALGFL